MTGKELIRVAGRYYVLGTSTWIDDRTRVLKHGDSFAVFDRFGDLHPVAAGQNGLFHEGTRYLSRYELLVGDARPVLLNSTVKNSNTLLAVDLTNPDLYDDDRLIMPSGSLHLFRGRLLWRDLCCERLRISNYTSKAVTLPMRFRFEADYVDIFEVRGSPRPRRGRMLPPEVSGEGVVLRYRGLDGVVRRTRLRFGTKPDTIGESEACFRLTIPPGGEQELRLWIYLDAQAASIEAVSYEALLHESAETLQRRRRGDCEIFTSNEQFNDWINRSQADLHMLTTYNEHGPYPYAGIPWFSTPFGRDGLITALEYLWINPEIARGVLGYLAARQAASVNSEQESEPGKILHEVRKGEMAALGEIPFGCYYGSVDSTPLFIILAGAYYERTDDRAFIEAIWRNIESALAWIDRYGDVDGDGFVEYLRHNPRGLVHQGWKDSDDSVFHADGRPAEGYVALCEVQGYVYAAKRYGAKLARILGRSEYAEELSRQAEQLRRTFDERFWCENLHTYAIALDGDKRRCRIRSSNAGQALFTGIVPPYRVPPLVRTLMSPGSFSGWGVRTLDAAEARYNPMSYHNGSVWPHDNALIAAGMARYGRRKEAMRILTGLFNASLQMDLHRLPEVFCGFVRRPDEGPMVYPSACVPQAWASAAAFLLLQSCLGLTFDAPARQLRFDNPVLPDYVRHMEIRNLRVADASLDLVLHRHEQDVSVNVLRKRGDLSIAVIV
jgi:glycogen debranching enzyme